MANSDQLRAKAVQFLAQAKATKNSTESLIHLLPPRECDTETGDLEQVIPEPYVIAQQSGGRDR